jgi:hypothetical protein
MRLTIIRDDSLVGVDGVFRTVDLSALQETGIRIAQWDTNQGHIEFDEGPNEDITDITEFQPFINLWTAAAPPEPTPAELKAAAHARINASYAIAVNALTSGYPESEIASWPKQETEARAWLADNNAATPWIDSAATARGIPKADFVTLVIANADALAPLHGALSGKRQLLRDQIDALGDSPTAEQLNAIQW